MKLTSSEISATLEAKGKETKEIGVVETKLKNEANEMKAAIDNMKETGEYDSIKAALQNGIRQEVKLKKRTEVTDKLDNVNKELEKNVESNQETIETLGNNLSQVESVSKAEVATAANDMIGEAKQSLSKAEGERKDLAKQLSDAIQTVNNIDADADKIEF